MMAEIKCQPGYKFNPKHFITDEAGANFNGIIGAYGPAGAQRAYTCQFHYKHCLDAMLAKFPPQCRGIMRIHQSPSRLRPSMRQTAAFINIHEYLI